MNILSLLSSYIVWHYSRAFYGIFLLWMNSLWFVLHFFSISPLLKTLLSPWRRLQEKYQGGLDLENILTPIIVNTLMRIVGALIRLVIIGIGLVFFVGAIILGALFFIFWFFAPLIIVSLFLGGLALL